MKPKDNEDGDNDNRAPMATSPQLSNAPHPEPHLLFSSSTASVGLLQEPTKSNNNSPKSSTHQHTDSSHVRQIRIDSSKSCWRTLAQFIGPGYMIAVGYMDPGKMIINYYYINYYYKIYYYYQATGRQTLAVDRNSVTNCYLW
jgi:hypothetical protein